MEETEKNYSLRNSSIKIFWVFIIGSVIGCLVELVVCLVQNGRLEPRQGLLYGPFIPVYGVGAIVCYLLASKVQDTKKVFLLTMLIGGVIEYYCSYFQELFFGTISWDYSNLLFNVQGRTSLLHCIYWGSAGILFMKLIYPQVKKWDKQMIKRSFQSVTIVVAFFMIVNIAISCMAAARQKERKDNIPPSDQVEVFLDNHFPDPKMNYVFSNKIVKDKKTVLLTSK